MADGSITISITGDAKDLEKELKKVNERIKQTGNESEKTGKQGSKLGSMISAGCKVAAAALAGVVTAAGGAALAAYKVGSDYETALQKVGTIADTAAKPLQTLSDDIMALSSKTGIAAADIAEATYSAISATGDTANAVTIVAQATQLATAGFASTADSLSTLTGIMNAYGMQASDLESISDSLIATQNLGVLTIGELSSSIGRAISTASAYGVGLSNLETGYIALTKAGIKCDESTTYLSSMFSELGDAGSKVGKILQEQTGKSFGQLMESGYSLADVLQILYDSCGQDSEALMQLWGSQEAGKASNAIVSQGLQQFDSWLKQVEDSSGATASAYEQMQATVSAQTDILKNKVKNLGIELYNSFSPTLLDGIESVNGAMDSLSEAFKTGGIEEAVAQLGTLTAQAVSKLIESAPQMLEAAGSLITSFGSGLSQAGPQIMKSGLELLNSLAEGIRQNLPQVLSAAAEALPSIVQGMTSGLDQITEVGVNIISALTESIVSSLPALIPAAMEALVSFSGSLRENVGQLVDAGLALITALAQSLIDNIPVFIETIPTIVTNIAGIINDNAPKLLETGIALIAQLALGLIQAIPTLIANIPQIIQAIVAVFMAYNWIDMGKSLMTAVKDGISSLKGQITAKAGEIGNSIKTKIAEFPAKIKTEGVNMISRLGEGITSKIGDARTAIGKIGSAIKTKISELPQQMKSIGGDIVRGIWNGISDKVSWIISMIGGFKDRVVDAIKKMFGIASPSKVMRTEVGQWIPKGVAVGIEENTPYAVRAAKQMARNVVFDASLSAARLSLVADTRTAAANASTAYTTSNVYNGGGNRSVTYNQTINSPKAMSRREVRRETKNAVRRLKALA